MQEIIRDRLNQIEDLNERRILKNIITTTFEGIIEYNRQMYQQLEERILAELDVDRSKFTIYTAVCRKNEFDPINDFLYPVVPQDIADSGYDITAITEKINQDGEAYLFTIFMECDSLVINEILSKESTYKSIITTDKNTYTASTQLRPSSKYMKAVEKIYEVFQYNDIVWKTVNNPYAQKFLDVVLVDAPPIDPSEKIKEITVNLGTYEQYKKIDMLLLWNINPVTVKNKSFPMPADDVIHYEYNIPLKELEPEHGYLASPGNQELKYVKHYPDSIVFISPSELVKYWNLLKVCQLHPKEIPWISYQLASNILNENFVNRYADRQSLIIRSQAEIQRLVNSFEAASDFSLQKVQIKDTFERFTGTYNLNRFMADNVRDEQHKRVMLLTFSTNQNPTFYTMDRLSFLVSEVQIRFPEYRCVGEIV